MRARGAGTAGVCRAGRLQRDNRTISVSVEAADFLRLEANGALVAGGEHPDVLIICMILERFFSGVLDHGHTDLAVDVPLHVVDFFTFKTQHTVDMPASNANRLHRCDRIAPIEVLVKQDYPLEVIIRRATACSSAILHSRSGPSPDRRQCRIPGHLLSI